ncbi:hypothetical protein N7462_003400 [Penicillium macrosclerotiorum]|uniref:uncharacterized protein n=1 Tax=Penicillium macrosclerotiorum TaxID=303699 RepID=UPI0025475673|nr:uncharacterized protein N7462_003400 [Penicillium macrosclerotiorum]KAJ5689008.1 hypothetical protein N7462_003400 [Penicillium macrosclerotiorum]
MEELLSLACIKEDELFWSQLATSSELNPEAVKPSDLDKQLADGIQCGFTGPFDDISAELQVDDAQFFTFPDDRLLEVPSLTLLNAAVKVAQRLRIGQLIWDFTAVSPFYTGIDSSPSTSSLPSLESSVPKSTASPANSVDLIDIPYHLRPTPIQRRIPHHPIIDLLPWPSTRDKLIQVFHLPVNFRPENARDPMGILRLVYDLEDDGGEGMRIFGQDPFEENIWEIGQLVFERWWWAFEFGVIDRCNRARDSRGERRLSLEKS